MPPALLQLPITVYRFDAQSKQYVFQSCVQCAVRGSLMPSVLTSSATQGMLGENMELLKAVMRAPAMVLRKGTRVRIYNACCEEVQTLPPTEPARVLRAYELPYLNLSTQIAHYRLRCDGALGLVDVGWVHCLMCHVPDTLDLDCVRPHLRSRANAIRKLLRDRRIVVEVGGRVGVYSCETLRRKGKSVSPE